MKNRAIVGSLLVALLPAITIVANRNSEVSRYRAWKVQMENNLNNYEQSYRFSLGVALRRIDSEHARILVALVGRVPNHCVKLQPLRMPSEDSTDESNLVGIEGGWSVGKERNTAGPGNFVENEETIEIAEDATAVAITVTPVANRDQGAETTVLHLTVPLTSGWLFITKDFAAPPQ